MKWLTVQLLEYHKRVALKRQLKEKNTIVKNAYNSLLDSYKDTIMFLKATY